MKPKAILYRMLSKEHVCPYGIKSKDLLKRQGFEVEDHHLKSRGETDIFKEKHNVKTTPQIFIDGKRIGGYDDLRAYFGKEKIADKDGTSYQPVISIFWVAFLMAIAVSWLMNGNLVWSKILELFVAISICILAIFKLRDLESFSNQFLGYDLLAQRFVGYAYIYPGSRLNREGKKGLE